MTRKHAFAGAIAGLIIGLAAGPGQAQFKIPVSSPPAGLSPMTGAAFAKGHYGALEQLPDWNGIWFRTFEMPKPGSPPPAQPKLKGVYLKQYQAFREEALKNDGVVKSDMSHCAPPGMPAFMQIPQYPYEFLMTPGRVTINNEAWMQTRKIWTDGRTHDPDTDPSYAGESIGHWEGDTLVADTVGIKDTIEFAPGMKHSDKFHMTERLHLRDPDTLVDELWMEDPEALAEPYATTVIYKRDRYGKLLEFECAENDRNQVDAHGDTIEH